MADSKITRIVDKDGEVWEGREVKVESGGPSAGEALLSLLVPPTAILTAYEAATAEPEVTVRVNGEDHTGTRA